MCGLCGGDNATSKVVDKAGVPVVEAKMGGATGRGEWLGRARRLTRKGLRGEPMSPAWRSV